MGGFGCWGRMGTLGHPRAGAQGHWDTPGGHWDIPEQSKPTQGCVHVGNPTKTTRWGQGQTPNPLGLGAQGLQLPPKSAPYSGMSLKPSPKTMGGHGITILSTGCAEGRKKTQIL